MLRKQEWYRNPDIDSTDPRFPWIGLRKDPSSLWNDTEAVKWIDGSSFNYQNWAHDEPKNEVNINFKEDLP